MTVRIINVDVFAGLAQLPDESVHCVVTSPPYWGLRDYGVPGQLGLETTLGEHIDVMVRVFRDVRRVLRRDGTLWLNYGDCYATSINGRSAADTKALGNDDRTFRDKPFSTVGPIYVPDAERGDRRGSKPCKQHSNNGSNHTGRIAADGYLKPKDLCGVPWRLAIALQEDGWWLRQDIIWSKPNPMPESVTDRCTKAHEYLFLLAKSERYFFDGDAIAEVAQTAGIEQSFARPSRIARAFGTPSGSELHADRKHISGLRNKRSVWEITTQPFPEAHFATFPPALIEPCIKAGCPEKACGKCGAPWERVQERTSPDGEVVTVAASDRFAKRKDGTPVMGDNAYDQTVSGPERERGSFGASRGVVQKETIGWRQSCQCKAIASPVPGTVLDPFGGSGTTGLVADRLKRNAILIELNPEYAAMSERRIKGDCPMFAEVSAA